MSESIFWTTNTLLTPASIVNFISAVAVLVLGGIILSRDRKNSSHQITFLIAFFLSLWAMSSTLADVMHSEAPAQFWAQFAILGPYFSTAFILILSHYFPKPGGRLSAAKAVLILLPSLIVSFLIPTPLNIVEIRLVDWGTDFTPGILYPIGMVYQFIYILLAAGNFSRSWRRAADVIEKKQISLMFLAIFFVTAAQIFTNALLPVVFGHTKTTVIGPASSFFFVLIIGYAIAKHKLLEIKVLATEIFAITLTFVYFVAVFYAQSTEDLIFRGAIFTTTAMFSAFLIKSVLSEVQRREALAELSRKLTDANTALKAADEAKTEFVSIVSHQLRTPVSVIKGYLSLLMEGAYGEMPPAFRDKAEQLFSMNERLVHMINNLLNVSRIEKGKVEYVCSSFDAAATVRQVVADISFKSKEKNLTLAFQEPVAPLPNVVADPDKLHEVVINLIDNAIKYTQRGSIDVGMRASETGDAVVITVKDTGVGMTEEDAHRVFEKFYRAAAPGTPRQPGTGLGLYVCVQFIKGMGGSVWIEHTEPGKGTTFAASVPTKASGGCNHQGK